MHLLSVSDFDLLNLHILLHMHTTENDSKQKENSGNKVGF